MRWVTAILAVLFLFSGFKNLKQGDEGAGDRPKKRLPVPRRMLGVFQLLIGLFLAGVGVTLFMSDR